MNNSNTKPPPERFELVLRDLGGSAPAINRLRSALKVLLRAFSLRCESIRELKVEQQPEGVTDGR
jgi:hypothetical protein